MLLKPFFRISLVISVFVVFLCLPSFSNAEPQQVKEPPQADDNVITGKWQITLKFKCINFRDSPKRTFKIKLRREEINFIWNEPSNELGNYVPGFAMMANFTTPKPTGSTNLMEGELSFDFPYNFENAGQCEDEEIVCADGITRLIDGWITVENVSKGRFIGQCKANLQGYWRKFNDRVQRRNKIRGWGNGFCWENGTVDTPVTPFGLSAGMCDVTWDARWREPLH